jgi:hypothetical protein
MDKRLSLLVGIVLLLVGVTALASNLAVHVFRMDLWRLPWRLWPLAVVALGLLFVGAPLLARGRRGLGALFIPGMPVLVTGGILLFASVFNVWRAWSWLWPLEVLSVSFGFLFAAIYARALWLLLPAIIIGANGLLFQFCAVTGWWSVWSVLWAVEPLSVGLALLVLGLSKRSTGLLVAAAALLGLGGVALVGMTTLVSLSSLRAGSWLLNVTGPLALMACGLLLLILSLLHRSASASMQVIGQANE